MSLPYDNDVGDADFGRIACIAGSIQGINGIPLEIRNIFKTVWDIDQNVLVQMAAGHGPFVCQSQSLSLYFESPIVADVVSSVFQAPGNDSF